MATATNTTNVVKRMLGYQTHDYLCLATKQLDIRRVATDGDWVKGDGGDHAFLNTILLFKS